MSENGSTSARSNRRKRWDKRKHSFDSSLLTTDNDSSSMEVAITTNPPQEVVMATNPFYEDEDEANSDSSEHRIKIKEVNSTNPFESAAGNDENDDTSLDALSAKHSAILSCSSESNKLYPALSETAIIHVKDSENAEETSLSQEHEQKHIPKHANKKRSRKTKNLESESLILSQLKFLQDDIITIENQFDSPIVAVPGLLVGKVCNNNISTIYCEEMNRFVPLQRRQPTPPGEQSEKLHDVNISETREVYAISLQTNFRTFSVLCQGLLAGIALAHCILIFLIQKEGESLAVSYTPSATHTFFILIFFLTTVCFIAACDRYDIASNGIFSGHSIKFPWTPALYLASLIITLVSVRVEDILTYDEVYPPSVTENLPQLIEWWRWMCVGRTSLLLLAWIALTPDPHTDLFLEKLSRD